MVYRAQLDCRVPYVGQTEIREIRMSYELSVKSSTSTDLGNLAAFYFRT